VGQKTGPLCYVASNFRNTAQIHAAPDLSRWLPFELKWHIFYGSQRIIVICAFLQLVVST